MSDLDARTQYPDDRPGFHAERLARLVWRTGKASQRLMLWGLLWGAGVPLALGHEQGALAALCWAASMWSLGRGFGLYQSYYLLRPELGAASASSRGPRRARARA